VGRPARPSSALPGNRAVTWSRVPSLLPVGRPAWSGSSTSPKTPSPTAAGTWLPRSGPEPAGSSPGGWPRCRPPASPGTGSSSTPGSVTSWAAIPNRRWPPWPASGISRPGSACQYWSRRPASHFSARSPAAASPKPGLQALPPNCSPPATGPTTSAPMTSRRSAMHSPS
jgi:hypothetical protein